MMTRRFFALFRRPTAAVAFEMEFSKSLFCEVKIDARVEEMNDKTDGECLPLGEN